ncbi:sialidase family protein [Mesomycoplasma neurolyticum]|uniref:exo-alpha-sialidase n=1 Tax=Mesomycoplasma neurolyticum TaxID=2120 RepID=A0A449A4T1_9BACT|nr:sialidase family protein [Mesomycoplasma neurolyticum]VEU59290.1 Sialidase B precursor [Mesomycoplasma neurolyticum]
MKINKIWYLLLLFSGVSIISLTISVVTLTKIHFHKVDINVRYSNKNPNIILDNIGSKNKKEELIIEKKEPNLEENIKSGNWYDQVAIENKKFTIEKLKNQKLFEFNDKNGAHSYRIPGVIKTHDSKILVSADKRLENSGDFGNYIEQVFKISNDNGNTWSENKAIVKVETPKTKKGLIIDGGFAEIEYNENNEKKHKLIYLFNLSGSRQGIPHFQDSQPFTKINDKLAWKISVKNNQEIESKVLLKYSKKENWWRLHNIKTDNNETTNTTLEPLNVYVNNEYDSKNHFISGRVYENVLESDFDNDELLESKATEHSIWDPYNDAKYIPEKVNYNGYLESFDNGETWKNFKIIDEDFPNTTKKFLGNAVGGGIQLKHQTNARLNGRVIFPMYSNFTEIVKGRSTTREKAYYIFSDDFGKNWNLKEAGLDFNLTESTMIEIENGEIYWLLRNSTGGNNSFGITKSNDGGQNWINPKNLKEKNGYIQLAHDGRVFSGMSHFKLNDEDYFIFAAPTRWKRINGQLFITDKKFEKFYSVYNFDYKGIEEFAYSYSYVVEQQKDYVDVIIVYEWSPDTRQNSNYTFLMSRPQGIGIHITKLRIKLK